MEEIELIQTKYNLGVVLCWVGVITGLIGLTSRIVFVADDYLWISVLGVIAGGIGISFGPDLKTVTSRTAKLKPVNPKDIK